MLPFAYTGLDSPRNANLVDITEDNLLPLLVIWLFFTTNPDYLASHSPEGISGFDFQDLANGLGLSIGCVQNLFTIANKNFTTLQAAANVFQSIAGPGGIGHYGDPTHCGMYDSITELSPLAKTVWED